ncbi:MAG: hypothetical protein Q9157_007676, partial [Trypethelium eluteriae]
LDVDEGTTLAEVLPLALRRVVLGAEAGPEEATEVAEAVVLLTVLETAEVATADEVVDGEVVDGEVAIGAPPCAARVEFYVGRAMLERIPAKAFLTVLNAEEGVALASYGAELFRHVLGCWTTKILLARERPGSRRIVVTSDLEKVLDELGTDDVVEDAELVTLDVVEDEVLLGLAAELVCLEAALEDVELDDILLEGDVLEGLGLVNVLEIEVLVVGWEVPDVLIDDSQFEVADEEEAEEDAEADVVVDDEVVVDVPLRAPVLDDIELVELLVADGDVEEPPLVLFTLEVEVEAGPLILPVLLAVFDEALVIVEELVDF